jgi:hypothetical protein
VAEAEEYRLLGSGEGRAALMPAESQLAPRYRQTEAEM